VVGRRVLYAICCHDLYRSNAEMIEQKKKGGFRETKIGRRKGGHSSDPGFGGGQFFVRVRVRWRRGGRWSHNLTVT